MGKRGGRSHGDNQTEKSVVQPQVLNSDRSSRVGVSLWKYALSLCAALVTRRPGCSFAAAQKEIVAGPTSPGYLFASAGGVRQSKWMWPDEIDDTLILSTAAMTRTRFNPA
jgi:hypothetical protein